MDLMGVVCATSEKNALLKKKKKKYSSKA